MLRFLLTVIVSLILGVAVLAVVVPMVVPAEKYKPLIVEQVKKATGREFAINGEIKFSLFPALSLQVKDVTLANTKGASAPEMASLKELALGLKLWPLLRSKIEVNNFTLKDAIINLEIDHNGKPNWDFSNAPKADAATPKGESARQAPELSLQDVKIENSSLTFIDKRSGQKVNIADLNLNIQLPSLASASTIKGSMELNKQKISLDAKLDSLAQLTKGEKAKLTADLSSDLIRAKYDGEVQNRNTLGLSGDVSANIDSIAKLMAWVNELKPVSPYAGPDKLNFNGHVALDDQKQLAVDIKELALDENRAKGNIALNLGGKATNAKGKLEVETLDLKSMMKEKQAAKSEGSTVAKPAGWSEAPINFKALSGLVLDVEVLIKKLILQQGTFEDIAVSVQAKDNKLAATLKETPLFAGKVSGNFNVDNSSAVPGIRLNLTANDVNMGPLLESFANIDKLEGTGSLKTDISSSGRNQLELMQHLDGNGSIRLSNGLIKGIALMDMLTNVKNAAQKALSDDAATKFTDLSASYAIQNGVLTNNDLILNMPLGTVTGQGQVSLGERLINYVLNPKVDVAGKALAVPVVIKGSFDSPSIYPDPKALLEGGLDTLKNLKDVDIDKTAKDAVSKLKDGLKDGIGKNLDQVEGLKGVGGLLDSLGGKKAATPAVPAAEPAPAAVAPAATETPAAVPTAPAETKEPAPAQ